MGVRDPSPQKASLCRSRRPKKSPYLRGFASLRPRKPGRDQPSRGHILHATVRASAKLVASPVVGPDINLNFAWDRGFFWGGDLWPKTEEYRGVPFVKASRQFIAGILVYFDQDHTRYGNTKRG